MYVCICNRVTDRDIHQAARNGAQDLSDLSRQLQVATCCGQCASCAEDMLVEAKSLLATPAAA